MMNGNVSVEFLGLFLEPGFCGVVVQKEAKAGKSGGGRGNGPYKGPRGAATSCLQAGRPEVEVFAQAEKSSMSVENGGRKLESGSITCSSSSTYTFRQESHHFHKEKSCFDV
jgi:hypothetical protein